MNAEEIEKITMGKFLTFEEDVMLLVAKGTDLLDAMYRDWETDRKSTRLNSSHSAKSRMPSSA